MQPALERPILLGVFGERKPERALEIPCLDGDRRASAIIARVLADFALQMRQRLEPFIREVDELLGHLLLEIEFRIKLL